MADEAKLQELEAYEQIRRLVADYCHGVDKKDIDRFAAVWLEDASWQAMPEGEWSKGRDEIVATMRGLWEGVGQTHHWGANHVIEVDGDTATGLADADIVMTDLDGKWFRIAASWSDVYERRGDRWGIARRTAQFHHYLPIADPQ